jgi:hypothetical protein
MHFGLTKSVEKIVDEGIVGYCKSNRHGFNETEHAGK